MTETEAIDDPATTRVLQTLVDRLRERHHDAVVSVLLYGSCLRSGDLFDGLVDLYLICDRYTSAYDSRGLAVSNWLLPPNVFYTELEHEGRTLRSKYALISISDFRKGCSGRWFESYLWGRFAQPTQLVYCRNEDIRDTVERCLMLAARTLLERTLPHLPTSGTVRDLWRDALSLSYSSELRAERSGRATELASAYLEHYEDLTRQLHGQLNLTFSTFEHQQRLYYRSDISGTRRAASSLAWFLRRVQGKFLSILRLVKGLFTFVGGIDYVVWKLMRHTGREIVVPDRVRRFPLLFMWGFFWRLYRQGVFR